MDHPPSPISIAQGRQRSLLLAGGRSNVSRFRPRTDVRPKEYLSNVGETSGNVGETHTAQVDSWIPTTGSNRRSLTSNRFL